MSRVMVVGNRWSSAGWWRELGVIIFNSKVAPEGRQLCSTGDRSVT